MRYAFDHIFDESATQREVYEHTSRPLLDGIFDGFNATVFAYGVRTTFLEYMKILTY